MPLCFDWQCHDGRVVRTSTDAPFEPLNLVSEVLPNDYLVIQMNDHERLVLQVDHPANTRDRALQGTLSPFTFFHDDTLRQLRNLNLPTPPVRQPCLIRGTTYQNPHASKTGEVSIYMSDQLIVGSYLMWSPQPLLCWEALFYPMQPVAAWILLRPPS